MRTTTFQAAQKIAPAQPFATNCRCLLRVIRDWVEPVASPAMSALSNWPFGVKHCQTIHPCNVDVAHGLALLFGIGPGPSSIGFEDEAEQSMRRPYRRTVGPSGHTNFKLAHEIGEDPDVLLAMAGKISADLRFAILSRPQLFAELIRSIKSIPDHAVLRIVRDVRDGNW